VEGGKKIEIMQIQRMVARPVVKGGGDRRIAPVRGLGWGGKVTDTSSGAARKKEKR